MSSISALASVALEVLWRPAPVVLAWLGQHPAEACGNAFVAVLLGASLLAITGRRLLAVVVTLAVLGVMGLVHSTKVALLGKPLYPWDVVLFREGFALLPEVAGWRWALMGLGCAGVAGVLRRDVRLDWRARGSLLVMVALVAAWLGPRPQLRLTELGVRHVHWDQPENYGINGLLLAFVLNASNVAVRKPADYGAESVRAVVAAQAPPPSSTPKGASPTVIVVMSESFFDPTRLPGVTFAEDPVPHLHRLQREASSGSLFPPVFGGGTANTEFEFLTGHSMHFLPPGSVPYQQYVRRKHPSLARIFAAQGYRTAAIHTHYRWFWEREQVYQHFGFQRFTSSEDMPGAPVDGKYISDAVLTSHIVSEFEAAAGPLFLFGVSMEAHGPYEPGRYAGSELRLDGPLDDAARAELTTYAEAARHADRELGALVAYFATVDRPVFLVFFGDHQPSLPLSLRQTGVAESLQDISRAQKHTLHEVPLVIWTNTTLAARPLGSLSPSFLGPLLLDLTGTPGTPYTEFLRGVGKEMPIVMQGLVSDAEGALHDEPPEALRALDDAWWTLEYDMLFGEDFAAAARSSVDG
ncbi:MAG: LTA synthase family protein [Archangium sp.]|nr:LTA synthase family protein [Archangium sp.]